MLAGWPRTYRPGSVVARGQPFTCAGVLSIETHRGEWPRGAGGHAHGLQSSTCQGGVSLRVASRLFESRTVQLRILSQEHRSATHFR